MKPLTNERITELQNKYIRTDKNKAYSWRLKDLVDLMQMVNQDLLTESKKDLI